MKEDILEHLETIARQIAKKHGMIDGLVLQKIEVDEDIFYPLISEFFENNLLDIDIEIEDLKELLNRAFPYFYDLGVLAAIQSHFKVESDLSYSQEDMLQLNEADLPENIKLNINNIALKEIFDGMYQYVIENKTKFEQEYTVYDVSEKMLLTAFRYGVELARLSILNSQAFGIKTPYNSNLKTNTLVDTGDMLEIHCPFCHQNIYSYPKENQFQHLAKVKNCPHVSLQYFQDKDKEFQMGENFRSSIGEAINNFFSTKDREFLFKLNDFMIKPEYSLDDFLKDMYVNNKLTMADEQEVLDYLGEEVPNYEIKTSVVKISNNVIVNYFLREKSF